MNQLSLLVSPLASRLNVALVSPATLGSVPPALVVGISGAAVLASMRVYVSLKNTLQRQGQLTPQKANLLLIRHVLTCCSVVAAAAGVLSQAPLVATIATALAASLLIWAAIELLRRRATLLAPFSRNGVTLQDASAEQRNDRAMVLAAVQQDGWALEHASAELRNDREIVLAAIQQNGTALQYASTELRNDREIVLAAVQQNWRALRDASAELRNDRGVVLAAVRQRSNALQYAGTELRRELRNDPPAGCRRETASVTFLPRRDDVRTNPVETLARLQRTLEVRDWRGRATGVARNISVNFQGENGIDAGGLRRHFWSLLGQHLCRERNDNHFLPARERDGCFVPDLRVRQRQPDQQRAREGYRQLGEVMSWGARHGLRLHPLFTLGVFRGMRAHLNGQLGRVGLMAGIEEPEGFEACFPTGERSDAHWQWLANRYGGSTLCQDDAWWGMDLQAQKAVLQRGHTVQRLVTEISQGYQGIADAIGALVEGMRVDVGDQGLAELARRSPERLKSLFLGELTADLLIARTRCEDPQHRRWLTNWIRRQPVRKLQQLVCAIRGSSSLGPDQTIAINIVSGREFHAHTCGGSVDMPRQQNERDFGQALDNWLIVESSGRAGFNAF